MLKVWSANKVREFTQLEVVDIKSKRELKETWTDFIVRENYSFHENALDTYMFHYPRRSCDAFAQATLQGRPWKENRIPSFNALADLQQWIAPLVNEERSYDIEKTPFAADLIVR